MDCECQGCARRDARIQELLELNNALLQRARDAEAGKETTLVIKLDPSSIIEVIKKAMVEFPEGAGK